MLAVLIEHGDGPQPILAGSDHWNTVMSLRNRHLLGVHHSAIRPRETKATVLGRQVIAAALGIEADKLTALQKLRDNGFSPAPTTPAAASPRRSAPIR